MKTVRYLLLALAATCPAWAQLTNAVPISNPVVQFTDTLGRPLAGAYLCSFQAGTTTPLATYTDAGAGTPHTNPVVLDMSGRAQVWVGAGLYKFILYKGGNGACPGSGTVQWSADQVPSLDSTNGVIVVKGYQSIFSVKDYGALANGVHNDAPAFNSAIAAAVAAGGGTVFAPCSATAYLLTSTITIATPNVSLVSQNSNCVTLKYTGNGSAIVWQMSPFSITPAGDLAGFTLIGTASGLNGVLSGQIVASHMYDVVISGFTGAGAACLHLHNAGNLATWTERNLYENVTLGGLPNPNTYCTNSLLMDSDVAGDSFGYNRFLDLKINASTGQVGINLASGFFYNSILNLICNLDNNVAGTVGAICVDSSDNWDSNTVHLNGEWQNSGAGTGTAYAVQVEAAGKFANLQGSNMSVFTTGGAQLGVNNIAGAGTVPTVTLVQSAAGTSWDTGTFTLNAVATTPQAGKARSTYGSLGMLMGTGIESPYVSMYGGTGNEFTVGIVPIADSIGQMTKAFGVDASAFTHIKSGFTVDCSAFVGTCVPPGAIDGTVAGTIGGFTSSHRAGLANLYLMGTGLTGAGQYNEHIGLGDVNFEAALGSYTGTNIAHPVVFGYSADPMDFEVNEVTFQTAPTTAGIMFKVLHGGDVEPKKHIVQPTGTHNIAGTCAVAGTTTCTFTFTTAFAGTPVCVASPQFETASGAASRWWVTPSNSSCIITFEASQTGTIAFLAVGNPD